MKNFNQITQSASKKYGVGVMGLFSNHGEFTNINDAITEAKSKNIDFIVEFLPDDEKKILSWNYAIEDKKSLERRYLFDADKRAILNSSNDEQWFVLGKGNDFETILPVSEVRHFERLEI